MVPPPVFQIILPSQNTMVPLAPTAASLESQLQEEKKERKIERFFWIFVLTVLIVSALTLVLPWYGILFVLLMSITMLIGCANWLEVPWVVKNLERIFDKIHGSSERKEVEPPDQD